MMAVIATVLVHSNLGSIDDNSSRKPNRLRVDSSEQRQPSPATAVILEFVSEAGSC